MKTLVLAIMGAMLLTVPTFAQDTAASYRSDHAGKRYDFTVTHAQIEATPDWPEDADNPPISPRKALALARMDLATFLPDSAKWIHPKVTLMGVGAPHKWLYVIEFQGPLPPNVVDGPVDLMSVVVLMNGTAVKPVVSTSRP